jgi:L-lactate dehydrogenase complex protein LldG
MSSRADILSAIRKHVVPPTELPSLAQPWIEYPDREKQFTDVLTTIGARVVNVPDVASIQRDLDAHDLYRDAKEICSLVPGVRANVDLQAIHDPHALEAIDFAVLPAEFAVAENGAVWVTDAAVKHRALYFICQHLAFVVPRDQILSNMHQAYERLSFGGERRFGVFISGPSKTADIEQSLVIGAHGPRSTIVYLLG